MRSTRLALVLIALLVVVVGLATWRSRPHPSVRPSATQAAAPAAPVPPAAVVPPARPGPGAEEPAREDPLGDDPLAALESRPEPWAAVDMKALREEIPNNVYWQMSAPTNDAEVLREREAERDRWNVLYGKVLSSTATEDEVDTYYAHRYRLSSDYVQFATLLLADYAEGLPQRDVALLKLAIEMHLARLEEIPRQIEDAHERRVAHEAARRAWLADQQAFEGTAPPTP